MRLGADKRRTALLLIAPAVLVLLAINLFPFLYAAYISFHHWSLARPQPPRFGGIFNYEELFLDGRFLNAIQVSFTFVMFAVAVQFLVGFLLAFVFSARLRGLATLRKISLLPVMVMPLVVGLVWFYIFNENFGIASWFATVFGLGRLPFLTDSQLAMVSIVIADTWQWTPFVMLVLFAALQSQPEYVYEAARMDGLSEWQIFWRVTLPLLMPAIWVVLILRFVDAFRMLELVFMMTKGGPAGATEVLPWYIYVTGFQSLDLGYAAAMAVLMIALVVIVSQPFVRLLERREP